MKTAYVVLLHDPNSSDPVQVLTVLTAPNLNIDAVCEEQEAYLKADGLWDADMWVEVIPDIPVNEPVVDHARLDQWMRDTVDLDNCGDRDAAEVYNRVVAPIFTIPDTECV